MMTGSMTRLTPSNGRISPAHACTRCRDDHRSDERHHLALHRMIRQRPARPIDGVLHHAAGAEVVLGHRKQDRVGLDDAASLRGLRRQHIGMIEVRVVERQAVETFVDVDLQLRWREPLRHVHEAGVG